MAEDLVDPDFAGALLDAAGSSGFAPMMLEAAGHRAGVDEIFAFRKAGNGAPEPLVYCSDLADQEIRTRFYASDFYRDDPAASAMAGIEVGQSFFDQVRAEDIACRDYRALCFDRPGFLDKVCFGWRGPTHLFVLNFYRHRDEGGGSLGRLTSLAGLGLTALVRHDRTISHGDLVERIEARMARAYPQLSPRERQVCSRTLAGWTASQIAYRLAIGPSTVPTYRQRAYQKLGFSTANDFLEKLLD